MVCFGFSRSSGELASRCMSWRSTPVGVSVLNLLPSSLCLITRATGEILIDYLIKMAFSFSTPACTCFFYVLRVVSILLSQIKTTAESKISPLIIYESRGRIKDSSAQNCQPLDRFIIDFSVGPVHLDIFFLNDAITCPSPLLSSAQACRCCRKFWTRRPRGTGW